MSTLSKLIPEPIKRKVKHLIILSRYDVKLHKNVNVSLKTQFEGKSFISTGCIVVSSYIGFGTFVAPYAQLYRVKIGRFCSIGQNVQTRFGLHPTRQFVSTHPAFFSLNNQAGFSFVKKQCFQEHKYIDNEQQYFVEIGNDVWLGNDVRILDGVRIHDGAIIGMGSVVTRDIEPYSINVGIPAKKIGYRFNQNQIRFLLKFKWWDKDLDWISENCNLFQDIDKFQKSFE